MIKIQSLKRKITGLLEQYELYFKFKYSPMIYSFLKIKNPKLQKALNAELRLYKSVLNKMPSNSLIFDVGANLGYTLEIFDKIGGSIIAVEPDLINLNCLRARHSKKQNVSIIPMALSDSIGKEVIYLQNNGDSLHTLSNKWKNYLEDSQNDRWKNLLTFSKKRSIETTTLDELINRYGVPYFIKIDVEGYEEKVIKGLNIPISLVSFEANLPQFLKETIECIEHLDKLSKTTTFNYSKYDKLILPHFVTRNEIINIISNTSFRCIDVFCKM